MAATRKPTPKRLAFLKAYPITGTIRGAAEAAGVDRSMHYQWLKSDPAYAEEFEQAKQEFTESLEAEAARRARDGWEEPVFHEGEVCGTKRKFSDTLAIFLMKANNPAKYRETIQNLHSGDVTLTVVYEDKPTNAD